MMYYYLRVKASVKWNIVNTALNSALWFKHRAGNGPRKNLIERPAMQLAPLILTYTYYRVTSKLVETASNGSGLFKLWST